MADFQQKLSWNFFACRFANCPSCDTPSRPPEIKEQYKLFHRFDKSPHYQILYVSDQRFSVYHLSTDMKKNGERTELF